MKVISGLVLGGLLLLGGMVLAADLTKDDMPRILKDLKFGNPKARAQAAKDAGDLGAIRASDAKEAAPLLLDLAKKDKIADVRRAAAEAIGKMGTDADKAVPVLIDCLKNDKAMPVKIAAAKSLGQFGSEAKEAIPALQEAAKQDEKQKANRPLVQAARQAIKYIRAK